MKEHFTMRKPSFSKSSHFSKLNGHCRWHWQPLVCQSDFLGPSSAVAALEGATLMNLVRTEGLSGWEDVHTIHTPQGPCFIVSAGGQTHFRFSQPFLPITSHSVDSQQKNSQLKPLSDFKENCEFIHTQNTHLLAQNFWVESYISTKQPMFSRKAV